ncbi:AMP-binding protein, partial [Mycobacterium tuberculosis]
MSDSSVLSLLRERAGLQPDDAAFTYIDYEQDWAGITETLTWSEVFRRTRIVAHEVRRHCTTGDRAVILAPQGLAYIAAFLGSMQAGAIAVPLSVPQIGSHDERVSAVLADASPSVILTTSAVAEAVAEHIHRPNTNNVGPIIEIDSLDLTGNSPSFRVKDLPSAAYLQYTSGSTRAPAGVMISHRNLQANFQQLMSNYFGDRNGGAPPDTTIVS